MEQIDYSLNNITEKIEKDISSQSYILGDNYTLADIVATCFLARIKMLKDM